MGARQHRGVRRRSGAGDGVRRVGRRRVCRHVARARPPRPCSEGDPASGAASWCATPERGNGIARRVVDELGVKPGDVAGLRAVPPRSSPRTKPPPRHPAAAGLPFQPVHDGVVLPQPRWTRSRRERRRRASARRHEPQGDVAFNLMDASSHHIDGAALLRGQGCSVTAPRSSPATGPTTGSEPGRSCGPTSPPTRCSGSRRSAWPRRSARTGAGCISSPGRRPFGGLARTHALEIPFVWDTLAARGLFTGDRRSVSRWQTRCTARGRRSPADGRPEDPGLPRGRPMASTGAPPCAST